MVGAVPGARRPPSLVVGLPERRRAVAAECHAGCAFGSIIDSLGVEARDLFPSNGHRDRPQRREAAVYYDYDDEFEVVRVRRWRRLLKLRHRVSDRLETHDAGAGLRSDPNARSADTRRPAGQHDARVRA